MKQICLYQGHILNDWERPVLRIFVTRQASHSERGEPVLDNAPPRIVKDQKNLQWNQS